jgi:hypothetical protein
MLTKDDAVALLIRTFDDNRLTFRDMKLLKRVFDEAVAACDESRVEDELKGRNDLPSQDTEDDFFLLIETEAEQALAERGIKASNQALEAIVAFAIAKAEYEPSDFYFSR